MGVVWQETYKRLMELQDAGYSVVYIQECQFEKELKADPEMKAIADETTVC